MCAETLAGKVTIRNKYSDWTYFSLSLAGK